MRVGRASGDTSDALITTRMRKFLVLNVVWHFALDASETLFGRPRVHK